MSEKIATEKELFTLGGGLEGDKPSNYDINRCVTKTRSTAFKSVTANLTSYQNLQLIPVSLFGKVVMADTIQIETEYNTEDKNDSDIEIDIVLLVDGKEIHYSDLPYVNSNTNDIFKTYEWAYNDSFVSKRDREILNDNKERAIQSINLTKVKELMSNHNNAIIQFKAKWHGDMPTGTTIKYTVKLLANGEEKYKTQNSIQLLTHEFFLVDVFFRKLFEITYDSKNDSITVLNNSGPEKTAKFEYDLLITKNYENLLNQHILTNSMDASLNLSSKNFKQNDIITLEVSNFTIKLSMSDGTEKTIIPKFTETKIGSKIKNGCKLSVLNNDINYYLAQIEILKDIDSYGHLNEVLFDKKDIHFCDFNTYQWAFDVSMAISSIDSNFNYVDTSNDIKGTRKWIKLF